MTALRKRLERATEDMLTLRNENLELYRRLRVVRASSRPPPAASGAKATVDFDADGNYISGKTLPPSSQKSRGPRRDVTSSSRDDNDDIPFARVDGDALSRKYQHLYEEKIDPFKLEELDRASVLARMNVFERGLAFTAKVRSMCFVFCVLCYTCYVLCAMCYVSYAMDYVCCVMCYGWTTWTTHISPISPLPFGPHGQGALLRHHAARLGAVPPPYPQCRVATARSPITPTCTQIPRTHLTHTTHPVSPTPPTPPHPHHAPPYPPRLTHTTTHLTHTTPRLTHPTHPSSSWPTSGRGTRCWCIFSSCISSPWDTSCRYGRDGGGGMGETGGGETGGMRRGVWHVCG